MFYFRTIILMYESEHPCLQLFKVPLFCSLTPNPPSENKPSPTSSNLLTMSNTPTSAKNTTKTARYTITPSFTSIANNDSLQLTSTLSPDTQMLKRLDEESLIGKIQLLTSQKRTNRVLLPELLATNLPAGHKLPMPPLEKKRLILSRRNALATLLLIPDNSTIFWIRYVTHFYLNLE